ncbi:hypothetical protein [Qipengyuania sp. NPDC077563]|uniref:hypothetical protein n=1 Tax=Qipengyuania sp. NPDC077563 TaxID=3364497 RepID=UPI00384B572F
MLLSAIGILILAVTILDALLTILDASGRSLFSTKAYRLFWWTWRHLAKLLPYRVAQGALSLAAPLMIGLMISLWIGGIVTGFALIFYGGMSFGDFITGGGSQPSLPAAFRLSWVTLSTIGFVEISPSNMMYSIAVALEALLGTVILTFSITYFLSVHRSILKYDRLVADLHHRLGRSGDPMESVSKHLSRSDLSELKSLLSRLHDGVIGLHQGLSRYPIVYFYRPRAEERSLPRTIHVLGTLADTLTHCHPGLAQHLPDLQALKAGMQDLVRDLGEAYVPVEEADHSPPVSYTEFQEAFSGQDWAASLSVQRFLSNCRCLETIVDQSFDTSDAYRNYLEWLPADRKTQAFVATIAHDLGYVEDLRPRRSSYLLGALSRGPKQGPQRLLFKRSNA